MVRERVPQRGRHGSRSGQAWLVVHATIVLIAIHGASSSAQSMPDAPSFVLTRLESGSAVATAPAPGTSSSTDEDPFAAQRAAGQTEVGIDGLAAGPAELPPPCLVLPPEAQRAASPAPKPCVENPVQLILTHPTRPLTSREKGILAVKDFVDPFNLLVITAAAGFSVAANPDSRYGAGFKGWGRLTGYSLVEDAQGEFIGTYLISSLAHEDPRYHRMPQASVPRRIGHALIHTLWTQHDDGRAMVNAETLLTYPISAELSNLYVPGSQTDAKSTARRVGIGLATDPVGNLIAEFLPDVARRIHVRAVFMQQIINQAAQGAPGVM